MTHEENVRMMDLHAIAREVIEDYPEEVANYRKGGPMLGFLLGQMMKKLTADGLLSADRVSVRHGADVTTIAEAQDALREELREDQDSDL